MGRNAPKALFLCATRPEQDLQKNDVHPFLHWRAKIGTVRAWGPFQAAAHRGLTLRGEGWAGRLIWSQTDSGRRACVRRRFVTKPGCGNTGAGNLRGFATRHGQLAGICKKRGYSATIFRARTLPEKITWLRRRGFWALCSGRDPGTKRCLPFRGPAEGPVFFCVKTIRTNRR